MIDWLSDSGKVNTNIYEIRLEGEIDFFCKQMLRIFVQYTRRMMERCVIKPWKWLPRVHENSIVSYYTNKIG